MLHLSATPPHAVTAPLPAAAVRPRVLVLAPQPALGRQFGLALRRAGLEVHVAADACEARALAACNTFAAAVLDLDCDADLSLCRALSRPAAGGPLPVLVVGSAASPWLRLRTRLRGARRCLVRPMALDAFVSAVQELVGRDASLLAALPRGV